MGKIVFFDKNIQNELDAHGYTIVDFSSPNELEKTLINSKELHSFSFKEMMFGNLQGEEYIIKSKNLINNIINDQIEKFGNNISIIEPTFAIKPPNVSWFDNHQDWNLVDEQNARSYSFWIPLHDVDERNGAFSILKGSHNFEDSYRSATTSWKYSEKEYKKIIDDNKETIPLKRGQAILFDSKLIHSTHPNNSKENRVAIIVGIKPKDEKMLHYYQTSKHNILEVFEINSEFFNNYDYKSRPSSYKSIGFIENNYTPLTTEQLETKILEYEERYS